MFITKEKITKVKTDELEEIKCDLCNRNLLKSKDDNDEIAVATLKFSKQYKDTVKEEGFQVPISCETSDFCEPCYKKIMKIIKNLGAKIPSFYFSGDEQLNQAIEELLYGE